LEGEEAEVEPEVSGETAVGEEGHAARPNLAHLAQQIYPIIKRMLAIERERISGRL